MFGTQALRLLRESWPSADMLAQELYAIFQDTNPTSSGPVTFTTSAATGTQAPVTIDQAGGDPALSFTRGANTANVGLGSDGTLQFSQNGGAPSPVGGGGGGGGGGMPGQVVSGGPGAAYTIKVWPNGLGGASSTVAGTQLSIDGGETIPAGTDMLVAEAGGNYYFQVPVWGAP